MLERFARVHDTMKYGIAGFIALVGCYHMNSIAMDPALALTLLQLLILAIGLNSTNIFYILYNQGTYIAYKCERESPAKWHRMSRHLDEYLLHKKLSRASRLPFPMWRRWGGDPANVAWILVFMSLVAWFEVCSRDGGFTFMKGEGIYLGVLACLLSVVNIMIIYLLLYIKIFLRKTEQYWKRYFQDFGTTEFPDPYNA
jgi:hypothetical protein